MSISSSGRFANVFVPRSKSYSGPFGRMFSKLAPWVPPGDTDAEKEAAIKTFSENNMFTDSPQDNDKIPAGYTYFGQFIDHDITFDPTSSLERQNDPNKLNNFRTPRLDLDCLYGEGPHDEPFMYSRTKLTNDGFNGFLLTGKGQTEAPNSQPTAEDDLPRNLEGRALLGDMRNDENTIVSQLQLSFIKFHNNVLEAIDTSSEVQFSTMSGGEKFEHAQRLVRWTYQYVAWNDYVKRLIKDDVYKKLLERKTVPGSTSGSLLEYGGIFYNWQVAPFIPVEFSVAAYRFGHSMVRGGYQVNLSSTFGFGNEVPIFPFGTQTKSLKGFDFLRPQHTLQWDWFLKLPSTIDPFPQLAQKIDMVLARSLFFTPEGPGGVNPLATLNILRNWRMEVPSGTSVALAMGEEPITLSDPIEDCLWVYILKEAKVKNVGVNSGKMLGPVGGRIVGEVFAGLLFGDSMSYVRCDPNWTPQVVADLIQSVRLPTDPDLPNKDGPTNVTDWELADIILFAGTEGVPF